MERVARWFRFDENGTTLARDTIAGLTTFIVMSYIIFVNPAILGFSGVPALQPLGLHFDAVLPRLRDRTFSIAGGIAFGFITYVVVRTAQGLARQVHR
ncbi:MAG: hypothetical protein ACXWYS_04000 [Gaiellaceae bacterium]